MSKGSPESDLYKKVEEETTILGRLASKIPGFNGYVERSRRREADQLLRQTISSRLEEARLKLSNSHQELSRDIIKAIDFAEDLGRADTRLMGLIGKVKDAPQGYAGFFDAVKVKEEDLERIYAFDESMVAYSVQIDADIDDLERAILEDGDIASSVRELDNTLREANASFNSRQEIISGVS